MQPALIVVTGMFPYIRGPIDALVPSVFTRLVVGDSVNDFEEELQRTDPIVILVGSSSANAVLRAFFTTAQPGRVLWVHSYYAGVDAFDLPTLADVLTAPMSNAQGVYASMLAEHVILSCLYFSRQVSRLQRNRAAKVYDRFENTELRGTSLGILGYGNIGRATAKVATPFNMRVMGYRRTAVVVPGAADDLGVALFSGDDGLAAVLSCDYVVAVLPLTAETKDFVTAARFRQMKPSAVFVNIGRGATVVETDLCAALRAGTIRGAAIDVHATEPLPESSELWAIDDDKLLLTPHNADISAEALPDSIRQFATYATDFVTKGTLPSYLVGIQRGY